MLLLMFLLLLLLLSVMVDNIEVNKSLDPANNRKLLPAAGGGFRINVFPKNHMNVGMDAGVGRDDWSINFRIGEAF